MDTQVWVNRLPVVRPHDGEYGVFIGIKTFVAAKTAGFEELACVVRGDLEEDDAKVGELSFLSYTMHECLPIHCKLKFILKRYEETDARKTKEKRVKEVARRLNLPRRTVRRYVDVSEKLDSTLISRLKKPSDRSDTDKELLEAVSPEKLGAHPKSKSFDSEKEKAKGFRSLVKVPVKTTEKSSIPFSSFILKRRISRRPRSRGRVCREGWGYGSQ